MDTEKVGTQEKVELVVEEKQTETPVQWQKSEGIGVHLDRQKKNTGVSRDEKGRLLPGIPSLNPKGRPSRQYERDMVNAIKDFLTPENIQFYLKKAMELAVAQQSARGIVAVMELGLAYGAGKPVQQMAVDAGRTELLEQLIQQTDSTPLLPDKSSE